MKDLNKLIKYKNETFFEKIKRKILSFFKKEEKNEEQEIYSNTIIIPDNVSKKEKEAFFDLYAKIKNDEINLDKLDDNTLYKVMIMLNEELNINTRKIEDQMRIIDISLKNLKVSNSGLGLIK